MFKLQKSISDLSKDQMNVNSYNTKLKSLSEELINYRPLRRCSCGGLKAMAEHQQQEYVIMFLMGLNDNFSHIRGHILLMEPLAAINKVFALVLQDER